MRQPIDTLKEALYWLAFSFLLINGLFFVLLGLGLLSANLIGIEILEGGFRWIYVGWGVLSFVVLAYVVRRLMRHYRSQSRISSPGPQGTIWISPYALKDFVLKSLEEKMKLHGARVQLEMGKEGVSIQIRISVPLSRSITDLGKEVQDMIKKDVESRIGVHVDSVEVFAASITKEGGLSEDEQEYTEIDIPERGQHE